MPRYYFDLINGTGTVLDEQGQEFKSPEVTSVAAMEILPDIIRDDMTETVVGTPHVLTVKVRDESGRYIFEASLALTAKWLI